jgi:arylformamidase
MDPSSAVASDRAAPSAREFASIPAAKQTLGVVMLYRNFATQEEIDRQYELERMVENPRQYGEFFVRESARARADLDCVLDARFGPTVEETLDIFPAADPSAPILLFIHGGYWRRLSSKEFSLVARGPVARGITVIVTNYALCPKVTLSEITRQSRAAVAWVRNTPMQFAGDRARIFVSGHSAGGQQVARLLGTDWRGDYGLPADVIKGGYSISGLFDLRPLRYSFLQPMLQLDEDLIQQESPQFHIPTASPPLIADVGGDESAEFRRQSFDYVQARRRAGLDGEYVEQAGKNHYTAIAGLADADSELCDRIASFIARC